MLDESPNYLAGLNRREVIRKIGLTSLTVLPLISSVVAPTAVHAASASVCACGCGLPGGFNARCQGCACNVDADCCGFCSLATFTYSALTPIEQPSADSCCPAL